MSSSAPPRRGPSPGLLAALAALLLVLLVVLAAVLGAGDGDGEDVQLSLPGAVATPTTSPTPSVASSARPTSTPGATASADPSASADPTVTPSPRDGGRPAEAVVVAEDGQVTVLSTADGSAVRVLVEAGALGGVSDVSLSPDRQTAYLSAGDCPGAAVLAVPVEGGEAEQVVDGSAAAVSPDGATLAYAAADGSDATICPTTLVLRDLDSGQERRLAPVEQPDASPPDSIQELSWAPDSRRLAVETAYEQTAVGMLDTAAAGSLDDLRYLDVEGGDLSSPVWLPEADRIAVSRTCCFPEYDEPPALLAVPPDGGDAEPVLDSEAAGSAVAVDRAGEQLLVLVGEELVMVPVAGGEPETLASAGLVVDAAW